MQLTPRSLRRYCSFLSSQKHLINRTRTVYDRALQSMPVTQHFHIWPGYIKFVRQCGVVDTALRVYRRYLKLQARRSSSSVARFFPVSWYLLARVCALQSAHAEC